MNFIYSLFNQPAIIIGLIALIGLVALKKPLDKIISGTFKTVVGFVILSQGGGIICTALNSLGPAFESAFHVQGVIPANEAVIGTAQELFGSEMALIMAFGFLANILIARFTKFKYIFLSGHHILFMAALLTAILSVLNFSGVELIACGSLLLGIIMTLCPAMVQPFYRKVTGSDMVAMGHFNGVSYSLSTLVARVTGDKNKSTEDLNIPKRLNFLRDTTISTGLLMTVIYLITFAFSDPSVTLELSGGDNIYMFAIMQAMIFTAGFVVVLQGVRMILAEIVPAFKGISSTIVPDAIPALDVPILYTYAPNAVMVGFLASLVGGMLSFIALRFTDLPLIIPGLIPLFFVGAGVGVLANAQGGLRGTIIAGIFNGAFITFLPALMVPLLDSLGFMNATFSDADFAFYGILIGNAGQNFGKIGVYALIVAGLIVFAIGSVLKTSKITKETQE